MTIDVGTGDGRAVLDLATREPASLVLGLDASAAAMLESSRRAAGPARKGGLPNARFVVAAAEAPPAPLRGAAELVTIRFPWGSLLRGVVGLDEVVACGVAGLVAPGGTIELLLAPASRDGLDEVPTTQDGLVAGAARALGRHGLELLDGRSATTAEVMGSGSTWAKRILSSRNVDRSVMLVRLVRAVDEGAAGGRADGSDARE